MNKSIPISLRAGAGGRLGRYCRDFAGGARQRFSDTATPADHRVHVLRTDMKRLRAWLRLAKQGIPHEVFRETQARIRQLKNAVAAHRDRQVLTATLRTFQDSSSRRVDSRVSTSNKEPVELPCLDSDFRYLEELLRACPFHAVSHESIFSAFLKNFAAGARLAKRLEGDASEEAFHELRKRVKDVCYQTEVIDYLPRQTVFAVATETADLLGEINDIANLRAHLDSLSGKPGLMRDLSSREERLRKKSLASARQMFRIEPEKRETLRDS